MRKTYKVKVTHYSVDNNDLRLKYSLLGFITASKKLAIWNAVVPPDRQIHHFFVGSVTEPTIYGVPDNLVSEVAGKMIEDADEAASEHDQKTAERRKRRASERKARRRSYYVTPDA